MAFRALLFLLVLVVSASAAAEPTADEKEQARGHMDLGRKHAADGDHAAALEAYRAADAIMGVPTTSLAVGEALAAMGRLIEARDLLLALGRGGAGTDDEPDAFKKARRRAKQLAKELAVRIPSVRVEVLSSRGEPVEAAEVSVGDKPLDATARKLPKRVDPGRVTVSATGADGRTAKRDVDVAEGEHHVVSLVLASAAGGEQASEYVVSPLVYVGVGVAVAGAIAGAAFGSAALSKSSTLATSCPGDVCPPDLADSADTMETFAHISTASFAAAGAGAVLAVLSFVLLSGEQPIDGATLDARGLTLRF